MRGRGSEDVWMHGAVSVEQGGWSKAGRVRWVEQGVCSKVGGTRRVE